MNNDLTGEIWRNGMTYPKNFMKWIQRSTLTSISIAVMIIPSISRAQDPLHCEQIVGFTQSFGARLDGMKRVKLAETRWQSTTPDFAGEMDCSIEGDEQLSCNEAWTPEGKHVAERAETVLKTILRCLTREWQLTSRRRGNNRAISIIWRPDVPVEFEIGLQSRQVPVRQESADSSTVLGEAPKKTLEWRRSLLITGLKAPAANAAAMAWQSDANKLCNDVRAVLASGRDAFSSIKKAKIDDDKWSTDFQLHGFGGCNIYALSEESSYYSCQSEPIDSLSQVRAAQDTLKTSLTACLDIEWRSARRARGNAMWIVELTEPSDRVSAEIRTREKRTGDFRLILDINSNAP